MNINCFVDMIKKDAVQWVTELTQFMNESFGPVKWTDSIDSLKWSDSKDQLIDIQDAYAAFTYSLNYLKYEFPR